MAIFCCRVLPTLSVERLDNLASMTFAGFAIEAPHELDVRKLLPLHSRITISLFRLIPFRKYAR